MCYGWIYGISSPKETGRSERVSAKYTDPLIMVNPPSKALPIGCEDLVSRNEQRLVVVDFFH